MGEAFGEARIVGKYRSQLKPSVKSSTIRQFAARVNGRDTIYFPIAADGIIALQSKTKWVHDRMT